MGLFYDCTRKSGFSVANNAIRDRLLLDSSRLLPMRRLLRQKHAHVSNSNEFKIVHSSLCKEMLEPG